MGKGRLIFKESPQYKSTLYEIKNKKGEYLGVLTLDMDWGKWVLTDVDPEVVYDASCLKEIVKKLEELDKDD